MKLIIVRGVPGTGKSTFCRTVFPNILHLENDMYHYSDGVYRFNQLKQWKAIEWCLNTAEAALKNKMDVVVSNTFTRKSFVDSYRKMAEYVGADFEVYRMDGSVNFGNVHEVPEEVFQSMKDGFEDYPGEILVKQNSRPMDSVPTFQIRTGIDPF